MSLVRRRPPFRKLLEVPWRTQGDGKNWSVVADIPSGNGRPITTVVYSLGIDAQEICTYIAANHNRNLTTSEERWQ